jgi:hypothetical protein
MASTRTSQTAGEARDNDGAPSGDVTPVVAVNGSTPDTSDAKVPTGDTTGETDVPTMHELAGIRYTGMADVKTITEYDLRQMGIEDPKGDLVFSAENGFTAKTSEFNAATRDALLANKDFTVA